jgi:RNA polymerase sigma-70 factor (ECF subfamily)
MRRAPEEWARRDRERRRVATECLSAFRRGDLTALLRLVGPDARVAVDRGEGFDGDSRRPVSGVAAWQLLGDAVGRSDALATTWEICSVNGGPGLVGRREGHVIEVVLIDGALGAVTDVWIVCNPDKLRHWRG